MSGRRIMLVLALLVGAGALGPVLAAPEDVAVGDLRSMLAREGTPLRERASVLTRALATLPHGTQVRVEERQGAWIRVSTVPGGGAPSATGWVRANQTVEPFALTQGGQRGPIVSGGRGPTQTDLQAAGRQFDPATEETYRREHPDLEPFYPLVDRIEASAPEAADVERFVLEGRQGRPGRGR